MAFRLAAPLYKDVWHAHSVSSGPFPETRSSALSVACRAGGDVDEDGKQERRDEISFSFGIRHSGNSIIRARTANYNGSDAKKDNHGITTNDGQSKTDWDFIAENTWASPSRSRN